MILACFRQWLLKRCGAILLVAGVGALASLVALLSVGLKADYRLEAFVATDDNSYARFRAFMEAFTSNEFALVAISSEEGWGPATEAILTEIAAELESLPNVSRCGSLTDIPAWMRQTLGERLLAHPLIEGNLLSADRRTAALLCQMSGEASGGQVRRDTVAAMKKIAADARAAHPQFEIILTGPYVTLIDMYRYVDRDLLVFSVLAFVLTAATLWGVFRRLRPMLYAAGVAAAAVLCTLGATVVLGIVTSLITQMLVILIIVLAVANCVHLAVAAEETCGEQGHSADAPPAAWATLTRMVAPCTAVMLTTAAGFAAVCISDIAPVRRFGALMALGLVFALVVSLAGVVALHRRLAAPAVSGGRLVGGLERCASAAVRYRRTWILLFLGIVVFSIWGTFRLRFESDFLKNFRPGSSVRQSYEFVETHLSPLGSMEVVVRREDGAPVVTADALRKIDAVGKQVVAEIPLAVKALTLADMLTVLLPDLPGTDVAARAALAPWQALPAGRGMLRNFLNETGDALRLNFRCVEGFDVQEKLAAAERIEAVAAERFGPDYAIEVTGLYHFYAKLVSNLLRDQNRALGLAVVAIFGVLWVLLRDAKLTAIAMAVNLMPVVVCLGAMGWMRIPVNMTTAMMLSVTLGIAVDDTVHYVWRLRAERATGGHVAEAIRRTHAAVGRACVFTTVVITGGFSILMLSQFLPTAYFGGLVGFTMLAALAADLLLLPALVFVVAGGARESSGTGDGGG